ncbi:MAG: right-handed parallel beta-helix repeat-containing protein [Candidatus Odinarchaeota archaeon]
MKIYQLVFLLVILVLGLSITFNPQFLDNSNQSNDAATLIYDQLSQLEEVYEPHDPIKITSNGDFVDQADAEGWNGTGSLTDPYIIGGLDITNTTTTLIEIKDTDVHFRITNCYLEGKGPDEYVAYYGIRLWNVTNGQIINNTIHYTSSYGVSLKASTSNFIAKNSINYTDGAGIDLSDSSNHNLVLNNRIYDIYDEFGSDGITVRSSSNNTIMRNIVFNNDCGIAIISAPWNRIFRNNVFCNKGSGIHIQSSSNCLIYNNNASYNEYYGIELYSSSFNIIGSNIAGFNGLEGEYHAGIKVFIYSHNNTITANEAFNNSWLGIGTSHSENNSIFHNIIYDNPNFGIDVNNNANYTVIRWNDLYRNFYPDVIIRQASDFGQNTTYEYNHWDSWIAPDDDTNGIVDKAYNITFDGTTVDPYPLVNPNHPDPHELSLPAIVTIGEVSNTTDTMGINWTASTDSWGHSVVYDLYYSPDNGTAWFTLAFDRPVTNFTWNLEDLPAGNYSFMVVARCSEGLVAYNISSSVSQIERPTTTVPTSQPSSTVPQSSSTTGTDSSSASSSISTLSDSATTTSETSTTSTRFSTNWSFALVLVAVLVIAVKRTKR